MIFVLTWFFQPRIAETNWTQISSLWPDPNLHTLSLSDRKGGICKGTCLNRFITCVRNDKKKKMPEFQHRPYPRAECFCGLWSLWETLPGYGTQDDLIIKFHLKERLIWADTMSVFLKQMQRLWERTYGFLTFPEKNIFAFCPRYDTFFTSRISISEAFVKSLFKCILNVACFVPNFKVSNYRMKAAGLVNKKIGAFSIEMSFFIGCSGYPSHHRGGDWRWDERMCICTGYSSLDWP